MKKVAIGIVAVCTALFLGFVGTVAMQPSHIHVERNTTIDATAADLEPFARDLRKVNAWSPWEDIDPELTRQYSTDPDPASVGGWYAWDGNDDVGAGKQTIVASEPGKVVHELAFLRPMQGVASATLTWTETDQGLAVTWAYDEDAGFSTKAFNLLVGLDTVLGPDFQKGMDKLKPLVEEARAEREAKEAAAAAEREAVEGEDGADEGDAG